MDIKYRERSEAAVTTLLLLLIIQGGITDGNDACSVRNRMSNLEGCLRAIRRVAEDDSLFWFGSVARRKCNDPILANTINCYNPNSATASLSELLFGVKNKDLSSLDRYINVQFTSEPGTYRGCDHEFTNNKTEIFSIDPLSMKVYEPWLLRNQPSMSWTTRFSNDLYTLVFMDPGFAFVHAIFMNIPGTDFTKAEVVKNYLGPGNARDVPNPYVFVLFRQTRRLDMSSVFLPIQGFNLTAFAELNSLQGPVGLTWLLASYDAYSISLLERLNISNNCGALVANAYMEHNPPPFLPYSLSLLDTNLRVHLETPDITYPCGDKPPVFEKGKSFYIDPIGTPIISTASARTNAKVTYSIEKIKMFPDNTIDFAGKLFSLLMVDADIPPGGPIGNKERPLMHGMIVDIQGDDFSTGHVVHPYLGPEPPDNGNHIYYFLLYEQKGFLNIRDTTKYTPGCQELFKGRCLFDVSRFVANNDLTLVGATWLSATNDKYVNCLHEHLGNTDNSPITSTSLLYVLFVALGALITLAVVGIVKLS